MIPGCPLEARCWRRHTVIGCPTPCSAALATSSEAISSASLGCRDVLRRTAQRLLERGTADTQPVGNLLTGVPVAPELGSVLGDVSRSCRRPSRLCQPEGGAAAGSSMMSSSQASGSLLMKPIVNKLVPLRCAHPCCAVTAVVAEPGGHSYLKIFTARAMTSPPIVNEATAWIAMVTFPHRASGMTSVGLKAVASVKPRYR